MESSVDDRLSHEVTISFRDSLGETVVVTLDCANTPFEREQVASIAKAVMKRAGHGRPQAESKAVRGCDDGELFRSWALPQ